LVRESEGCDYIAKRVRFARISAEWGGNELTPIDDIGDGAPFDPPPPIVVPSNVQSRAPVAVPLARKRAAANLYHKPLQTREPRGIKPMPKVV
jgi:hypothetical protein